jgi:HD-GYP domain-containing protein (c-di-GMP phosphodiesterase class II)
MNMLSSQAVNVGTAHPSSVLHALSASTRRLERVLLDLRLQPNPDTQLRSLAQDVVDAVRRNQDVALAGIYLKQIAGLYAVRHCVETAIVAIVLARALGKADRDIVTITAAALTMNIGMVLHAERFQNRGADLSTEERAIITHHPSLGADLLRSAGVEDQQWIDYVLQHHEADDGSGYPAGLRAPEIPENAKLIGLADRYCACVSARNYRRSMLPPAALELALRDIPAQPDERLKQTLADELGPYPPGTLVRLENGETGVVSRRLAPDGTTASLPLPVLPVLQVHALRGPGGPLQPPLVRLTSETGCAIAQALHEDEAGLRFSMKHIWGADAAL